MKPPKNINYPIKLGKKGNNILYSQEGKIRYGRWFNINHEIEKKPKWVKVSATGSLVDRSIGGIPHFKKRDDFAIITYFADPIGNMPRFDVVPITSSIFDTDDAIGGDDEDFYNFIPYPTPLLPNFPTASPMAIATAILGVLILTINVGAE